MGAQRWYSWHSGGKQVWCLSENTKGLTAGVQHCSKRCWLQWRLVRWHSITAIGVFILSQHHFWKRLGFSPAGFCWEMPAQIWRPWRCIVSLLIAIDTWWGINSAPLNITLSVDGWEEFSSPSSLVLPELCLQETPLPLHVAKSCSVQHFSEIVSHFAYNHSTFAEQTSTLQQTEPYPIPTVEQIQPTLPSGASSLVSLWAVCCMASFGNLFFFFCCHFSKLRVLLGTGWAEIAIFLCSRLPDLRGGAEVQASRGWLLPAWTWEADENWFNSGKGLVSQPVLCYA